MTATSTPLATKRIFRILDFMYYWVYSTCSVCFYVALNRFIMLWVGTEYLLSDSIVAVLVINFYMYGMHQNMLVFRNALGLFVYARWKPIAEALMNIMASLILIHYLGFIGVFLGITVSFVTTALWIEPYVLYKRYFNQDVKEYFLNYLIGFSATLLSIILSVLFTSWIAQGTFLSLLISVMVGFITHNVIVILVFRRRMEYQELKKRIASFLKLLLNKKNTKAS